MRSLPEKSGDKTACGALASYAMSADDKHSVTPSHDDLIKELLHRPRHLADFFRAFLPEALEFADLDHIEYMDKEHPGSRRQPRRVGDLLVKTRWRAEPAAFLIHLESQNAPQTTLLERVTEYAMRDSIRYELPVMPVLLLTYTKPQSSPPLRLSWKFGKLATIQVRCPVLHFQHMDPRPHLQSQNVVALALSSLMKLDAGSKWMPSSKRWLKRFANVSRATTWKQPWISSKLTHL